MIKTKNDVKARKRKRQTLAVDIPVEQDPDLDCDVCDRRRFCGQAISGSHCSQFLNTPDPEQNNGKKAWKIIREAEG